jgi:hypothetical protein
MQLHAPTPHAAAHPADQAEHLHTEGKSHPLSHKLLWGVGIAAAAFIALPYFGGTLAGMAGEHAANETLLTCGTRGSVGVLAPAISGLVAMLPGGIALASGGWLTAAAALTIGFGGHLLANYLEKKERQQEAETGMPHEGIRWSKVVRNVATATSIFISLPGILTGITMGVEFLSNLAHTPSLLPADAGHTLFKVTHENADALKSAAEWTTKKIGAVGMEYGTVNGLSGGSFSNMGLLLSHVASCGGPLLGLGAGGALHRTVTAPVRFVDRVVNKAANVVDQQISF